MAKVKTVVVNVLVGLLLAGPLAALAVAALPEQWRGPAIPWGVVVISIALVAFLRQPRRPAD